MIILASQSLARRALLQRAGVTFEVQYSPFDEDKAKLDDTTDPATLALKLAQGKALATLAHHAKDMVIAADQVLHQDGRMFHKTASLLEARQQLLQLRGKTHHLVSACVCARHGRIVWHHVATAEIVLRNFSDQFLDHYLQEVGEDICHSVGAYHYEGIGIRLMERTSGSDHTILGLPLFPLLSYLRSEGLLPS